MPEEPNLIEQRNQNSQPGKCSRFEKTSSVYCRYFAFKNQVRKLSQHRGVGISKKAETERPREEEALTGSENEAINPEAFLLCQPVRTTAVLEVDIRNNRERETTTKEREGIGVLFSVPYSSVKSRADMVAQCQSETVYYDPMKETGKLSFWKDEPTHHDPVSMSLLKCRDRKIYAGVPEIPTSDSDNGDRDVNGHFCILPRLGCTLEKDLYGVSGLAAPESIQQACDPGADQWIKMGDV